MAPTALPPRLGKFQINHERLEDLARTGDENARKRIEQRDADRRRYQRLKERATNGDEKALKALDDKKQREARNRQKQKGRKVSNKGVGAKVAKEDDHSEDDSEDNMPLMRRRATRISTAPSSADPAKTGDMDYLNDHTMAPPMTDHHTLGSQDVPGEVEMDSETSAVKTESDEPSGVIDLCSDDENIDVKPVLGGLPFLSPPPSFQDRHSVRHQSMSFRSDSENNTTFASPQHYISDRERELDLERRRIQLRRQEMQLQQRELDMEEELMQLRRGR